MVHYFICFTLNFLEFISYLMTVFTTNKVILLKDTMHYKRNLVIPLNQQNSVLFFYIKNDGKTKKWSVKTNIPNNYERKARHELRGILGKILKAWKHASSSSPPPHSFQMAALNFPARRCLRRRNHPLGIAFDHIVSFFSVSCTPSPCSSLDQIV